MAIHSDWTVDPQTGRCNSSATFCRLAKEVARIIRNSSHDLIAGQTESVAGLILARLAHIHGLAPRTRASVPCPACDGGREYPFHQCEMCHGVGSVDS